MKSFLKRYVTSFAAISLIFFVISLYLAKRYNSQLPYINITLGAAMSAVFAAIAYTVFCLKKGGALIKTAAAFFIMLPIAFITKRLFGVLDVRFSFIALIYTLIIAVVYAVIVFISAKRSKKEENDLNKLLYEKNNDENT